MAVDKALLEEAYGGFGVVEVGALNDGGQKTVRLVERDGDRFVLKVIQAGSSNPQAMLRASREVELLKNLDHENVVRVSADLLELGDPPVGAAWLEEFLDGEDLSDRLSEPWEWTEAAEMGRQVGLGLGAIHAVRVVHRDLSPNNIRCLAGGGYKVMDPGFGRHELLPPITVMGHPGTPGFMSPEHLRTPPAGPTAFSDVFCLGILIWLAKSGRQPIPYDGDMTDYATRLAKVQIEDADVMKEMVTEEQFRFLQRCLHKQPARRYRNGSEAAAEIEVLK